ncbi:MAG: eukaryotic translation initiation factor eIF-2 alpha [Terrestrivirus sp.]|uniref:Eukaryotic translation initiation factor eIF-2 alpha n=1 Tax=Terrestrivirus sp. TaxID=2487775 RepID=A0A3G4ZQS1_9VIRU|nr:MAG: eukaryotic translation initiation factor eIF-2 alpha [Terrestrivirus sp.]
MRNFYAKEYPDENDIIIVKLTDIQDNGIYGQCIDYPKLQIFLVSTEITKRKVHLAKFFSPDKLYPMIVLGVNTSGDGTGSVDVSYKKINEADRTSALELFDSSSKIYDLGLEIMDFYDMIYKNNDSNNMINKEELFKLIIQNRLEAVKSSEIKIDEIKDIYLDFLENPHKIFDPVKVIEQYNNEELDVFIEKYTEDIAKRLHISDIVACCDFSLIVITNDAVNNIKRILTTNFDTEDNVDCEVCYIASPKYRLQVKTKTKTQAFDKLEQMSQILENNTKQFGGTLNNPKKFVITKDKQYSLSNLNKTSQLI